MALPTHYRRSRERYIKSFDWSDIATGVGYNLFELATTADTDGTDYLVMNSRIYSQDIELSKYNYHNDTEQMIGAYDFDGSPMTSSRVIGGKAFFNLGYQIENNDGGMHNTTWYVKVKLQKYDGSDATNIATAETKTVNRNAEGSGILSCECDIEDTVIATGENIRIRVEYWIETASDGAAMSKLWIGFDPMNRDGDKITPSSDTPDTITRFKCHIPFKIEK